MSKEKVRSGEQQMIKEYSAQRVKGADRSSIFATAGSLYRHHWKLLLLAAALTGGLSLLFVWVNTAIGPLANQILTVLFAPVIALGMLKLCWNIWEKGKASLRDLLYALTEKQVLIPALLYYTLMQLLNSLHVCVDRLTILPAQWSLLLDILCIVFYAVIAIRLFMVEYLLLKGETLRITTLLKRSWQMTQGQWQTVLGFVWGVTWRGMLLMLLPMIIVSRWIDTMTGVMVLVEVLMILYTPYVVLAQTGCFQKVAQVDRKRGNKSR